MVILVNGVSAICWGGFGHIYAYASEKYEYLINRYALETKRQLDVLNQRLATNQYIAGDNYTIADIADIADIAIWPWYGGLVKDLQYGAAEFLSIHEYEHVIRWTDEIYARPAVKRGRRVNRIQGDPGERLRERHDASDFL